MMNVKKAIQEWLPSSDLIEKYFDRLWPICRSITGNGVRETFKILQELVPFETVEVPSGTKVFDWVVPNEWNIDDAWIEDESGKKIVDFKKSNLHVLGYSTPVDVRLTLDELQNHLYSSPEQPDAITYLTSYYKERWGFCIAHNQRTTLKPGQYRAVIRSTLAPGHLTYGHVVLPATTKTKDEILISTDICHPSMANNELSGPLVQAFMYQALSKLPERRFNYRFVFIPETIGSITYLAKYGEHLKSYCKAGLVLTCVGDDANITYKRSRQGNSLIDRVIEGELADYRRETGKNHKILDFYPTGSDERQYCSPGFNLPVGVFMRSKPGEFHQYHTSLDDKSAISFEAHRESIALALRFVLSFEKNRVYRNTVAFGEPMLGKRGLYSTLGSQIKTEDLINKMMWLLNYSDGTNDLAGIAVKAECSVLDLHEALEFVHSKDKDLLIEHHARS